MSKSHKSHGRGGLPRHRKLQAARGPSGRTRKSGKQTPAGTKGIPAAPLLPIFNAAGLGDGEKKTAEPRAAGFISLTDLKEAVIRPGIEKQLEPLLLYRGALQMGKVKRLWNYVQLMKLAGSSTASEATKLFQNPEVPHLLGPASKALPILSIETFLSRIHDHMDVAANIPGLPEYIREQIAFRKFNLTKISAADRESRLPFRRAAGEAEWNKGEGNRVLARVKRFQIREVERPPELFYPFMIHDPEDDASDLVQFINKIVPRGLTPDMRADVCQEMLLAILTGEIARDQAHNKRFEIMRRVLKMNGVSDSALRLDAQMPGHSKTLMEILTDSEWVAPEAGSEDDDEDPSGFDTGTIIHDGNATKGKLYASRIAAHAAFDKRWQRNRPSGLGTYAARDLAYRWLAKKLDLSLQDCHIGQFDIPTCEQVVDVCEEQEAEYA